MAKYGGDPACFGAYVLDRSSAATTTSTASFNAADPSNAWFICDGRYRVHAVKAASRPVINAGTLY